MVKPRSDRTWKAIICSTAVQGSDILHFVALRNGIAGLARTLSPTDNAIHACPQCHKICLSSKKALENHLRRNCDDTTPEMGFKQGPALPRAAAREDRDVSVTIYDIETNTTKPDMSRQIEIIRKKLADGGLSDGRIKQLKSQLAKLVEHQNREVFVPNSAAWIAVNTITNQPVDPEGGETNPQDEYGLPNVNRIFRGEGTDPTKVTVQLVKDIFWFVRQQHKKARERNNTLVNRTHIELPDGTISSVEKERKEAYDTGRTLLLVKLAEWVEEGAKAKQWQRRAVKELITQTEGVVPPDLMLDVWGQKMVICTAADLVPDHDHETGKFRRMMHKKFNLALRTRSKVIALAHNATRFDNVFMNDGRLRTPDMLANLGYNDPCERHADAYDPKCWDCKKVRVELDASMGDRGVTYKAYHVVMLPQCMHEAGVRCKNATEKGKDKCNEHSDHHDRGKVGAPHDGVRIEASLHQPIFTLEFGDSAKHVVGSLDALNEGAIPSEIKNWRRVHPNRPLPPRLVKKLRDAFPTVSQAWEDDTHFVIATKKNLCPHEIDKHHKAGRCPYGLHEWWKLSEFPPPGGFGMEEGDKAYIAGKRAWDVLAEAYDKSGRVLTGWDYYEIYLRNDVLQLADVVKRYRDAIWDTYKIEALRYASSSAVALDAVLKTLPEGKFHLPTEIVGELLRRRGILGGYVAAPGRGKTTATCCGDNVMVDIPGMPSIRITKLDFASLYPTILLNFPAPAKWEEGTMEKDVAADVLEEILEHDRAWLCDQEHGYLIDATVKYCCGDHDEHDPCCAECADMRLRAGNLPACLSKREVEFHEHGLEQRAAEILRCASLRKKVKCASCEEFSLSCAECVSVLDAWGHTTEAKRFASTKLVADFHTKRVLVWSYDYQYYIQKKHITIVEVHDVYRYEQAWDLKEVTQGMITARRCAAKAGNHAFAQVYKTLVNAFIGKTAQDDKTYATRTTEITDMLAELQRVVKLQSDPRFRERVDFGDSGVFTHAPKKVTSKQTLWTCFVYSVSKMEMREFLDLFDDYFGPTGYRLTYTDTDSMVLVVYEHEGGRTLFGFMRDHAEWLGLAGYPIWHALHDPRFPKRCTPTDDTIGHGVMDLEDVGIPDGLGYCDRHRAEQHTCLDCVFGKEVNGKDVAADEPCETHKWSEACVDCKAAADKWKDEPSMAYDLRADGPKLYRVRIVKDIVDYHGGEPVGTEIIERGEVVGIVTQDNKVIKLKSKLKAKGVGRSVQHKIFSVAGEAALDSGAGASAKFAVFEKERWKDGVTPHTLKNGTITKRVGCAGVSGGKGKRARVCCAQHAVYQRECRYCYEHEESFGS